ncbi:MAG: type II toxin-antitoxin system VapB family antitoxin [Caldilineaceae bacterium]
MSLNIKSKEAYDLASELAQLTGQSMTAVVLDALRRQRKQLQVQQKAETKVNELRAIAKRCALHIHKPVNALEHGDMLYDENGMP